MLEVRPFSPRDRKFGNLAGRGAVIAAEPRREAETVIDAIREGGSSALRQRLENAFGPGFAPEGIRLSVGEIADSRDEVSEQFLTSLSLARVNIRRFHEYQRRQGYLYDEGEGVRLSRVVRPLRRVGICCGSFMALLMHAVPAQVAGVREIAVAARPREDGSVDPRILATAKSLGLEEVYRLPGPEAVGALAFGVDPVKKVDKIVGPGGPVASAAKRLVDGLVGVDGELELGELVVVADAGANAKFIAGDLIAQAEHEGGLLALLTTDRMLAESVRIEADRLVAALPNRREVRERLERHGAIYLFPHLQAAIDAANRLAPARLSLMTADNDGCLSDVDTAGAVFVGPWSTEAAGDFFSGMNSFLPAGGRAAHASGLGVSDFVREMSVVEYGPDRLLVTGRHLAVLAGEENLPGHGETVRERLELLKLAVD